MDTNAVSNNSTGTAQTMRQTNYWKQRLKDFKLKRYFDPTTYGTANIGFPEHPNVVLQVSEALIQKLHHLAPNDKAKHLVFLAALGFLTRRYTGFEDSCVFTPNYAKGDGTLIPFVTSLDKKMGFKTLLSEVKKNWVSDLKHAHADVLKNIGINDDEATRVLKVGLAFFSIHDQVVFDVLAPELLFAVDTEESLSMNIRYNPNVYSDTSVTQIGTHLLGLLEAMLDQVGTPIQELDFISEAERQRLLVEFNDTKSPFPKDKMLVTLFEERVASHPDKIALRYQNIGLTYAQVNQQANQMAHYLISLGIDSEDLIPILMDRSDRFLITILAIWKAGATYIPFETNYPEERIIHILQIAKSKHIFIDRAVLDNSLVETLESDWTVIDCDLDFSTYSIENPNQPLHVDQLSYVIFTSGSTGTPKGVMIEHGGMLNHLYAKVKTLVLNENSVVAQNASQCFDISVWQFFSALLVGGQTVVYDKEKVLDPIDFLKGVHQDGVTILEVVPSYLSLLLDYEEKGKVSTTYYENLKYLMVTGETLPLNTSNTWVEKHPTIPMINAYGPTEASDDITQYNITEKHHLSIPIGSTLQNFKIYIMDEMDQLCGIGVKGELCVSGIGVGRGYLNDPERTRAVFTEDPFRPGIRMYRTGDLAKFRADGVIEFLGRKDYQVKLNGYRIELGEIESQLSRHEGIKDVIVVIKELNNKSHLVTYYTCDPAIGEASLSQFLAEKLPEYMVPHFYVNLAELPLTPNGKFDRESLPEPHLDNQEGSQAPESELEQHLVQLWMQILGQEEEKIGVHSDFFKLGGDSLKIIQLNTALNETLKIDLPVAELFRHTTIHDLVQYIQKDETVFLEENETPIYDSTSDANKGMNIAVIGMSGRFPGAQNLDNFWDNLVAGVSSIQSLSDEEMLAEGISEQEFKDPAYVKANAYLTEKEFFDASFFGYRPDEATLMDPQVRLFHEVCWHALEDAGYAIGQDDNRVGLFAGATANLNWQNYVMIENLEKQLIDNYSAYLLMNISYMCSRVSYQLGLSGPSVFLNTACSTSLVAIQRACASLMANECKIALAGGITINNYSKEGYVYQEGMIKSEDGVCRPFDEDANGTVVGEGAGMVVLKPLSQALKDGDHVYAVIKGAAVNNDGSDKVSYTAPSIDGQHQVITKALKMANIPVSSIGLIETHGTGTKLGDPIEIQALKMAYGPSEKPHCAIGAVKSNVGHTDAAAGAVGFIKTALALKVRQIPPLVNFNNLSTKIDLSGSPFYVNTTAKDWESSDTRRAGVSSFGIGGTNAHVILEEAPYRETNDLGRKNQLLSFSAKTVGALRNNIENFVDYLNREESANLKDMAYTLNTGRKALSLRKTFACSSIEEAQQILSEFKGYRSISALGEAKDKTEIVFMFSGQGAQYVTMCRELYETEKFFREILDECLSYTKENFDMDFRSILFPKREEDNANRIKNTKYTQPILFIVEYALARLLMHWGIKPHALIGHSIGEYAAACIADVFNWKQALKIVVQRGQLMGSLPRGSMLSIAAPVTEIEALLEKHEEVSLAAVNSTEYCVVSGNAEAIDTFKTDCNALNIKNTELKTSHAFHSAMMDAILEPFMEVFEGISMQQPKIKVISNVTGKNSYQQDLRSPQYWAQHLRQTVKFAQGIETLLTTKKGAFIEVGPGRTLTTFVNSHADKKESHKTFNTVRHPKEDATDTHFLLKNLGKLWEYGVALNWKHFYQDEQRHKVSLPGYAFEKVAYPVLVDSYKMILNLRSSNERPLEEWFYQPSWKLSTLTIPESSISKHECTLIFTHDNEVGQILLEQCCDQETKAVKVMMGNSFEEHSSYSYHLDPLQDEDHKKLLKNLENNGLHPTRIIYAWGISSSTKQVVFDHEIQQNYFGFLVFLKAFDQTFGLANKQLVLITAELFNFLGNQNIIPCHALVSGLLKVIPQEYSNVMASHIDITLKELKNQTYKKLLAREIRSEEKGKVVTLKNGLRWVRVFDGIALTPQPSKFKKNGIYLITGGLGALGYGLSKYLLETYKAHLILTGKSSLSQRPKTDFKVRRLEHLKSLEGTVSYLNVDVSDEHKMRESLMQAELNIGKINGIIHAAGTVIQDAGMIPVGQLSANDVEIQMTPKASGIQVLMKIFEDSDLDFSITTSSISTVLGGMGFGAYVTANVYLDHFINAVNQQENVSNKWLSLNLDGLSLDGSVSDEIHEHELNRVFEAALHLKDVSQVVVSKTYLEERLDKWIRFKNIEEAAFNLGDDTVTSEMYDLHDVDNLNETEKKLLRIWRDFFGKRDITSESDFFDIGGDSLKALSLVGRINKQLEAHITISDFFQNPSVQELGTFMNILQDSASGENNLQETNQNFVF